MSVTPQALLPPLPVPLPPWARALIFLVETVAGGIIWKQFAYGTEMRPTGGDPEASPPDLWVKSVVIVEDTVSTDPADDLMFSFDVVNITNGAVDSTWTDSDFTQVHGPIAFFCQTVAPLFCTRYHFKEVRSYLRAFNPYSVAEPFADTGPPSAIGAMSYNGNSLGNVPPQAAVSVTEMTSSRKNWGRFYLPALGNPNIDTSGRIVTAQVSAIANAVQDLYEGLAASEFYPVVPVTQVDRQPVRALQVVSSVRVDDVIDVIRRRRHRTALTRVTLPVA